MSGRASSRYREPVSETPSRRADDRLGPDRDPVPTATDPVSPAADPDSPASAGERLEREPGAERIIAFTDAAVAIALTLLVLPLMEAVTVVTEAGDEPQVGPWLDEHQASIAGFLMSFILVAAYWAMHHGAMGGVRRFTGRMLVANFLWILAIVMMPVSAGISIGFETSPLQVGLYIGNTALMAVALGWIELETLLHPEVAAPLGSIHTRLGVILATLVMLVLCYILVLWTPLGWLGMCAMALIGPLARPLGRVVRRLSPA